MTSQYIIYRPENNLAIEKIRRKPLSSKAQEAIANVGVTLLIALTVFLFYSDIIKFGVMLTPALVVDGQVKSAGKVLGVEDIKKLLA